MLKALAWKEWRTQRSLIVGAVAMAAALPLFMLSGALVGAANVRSHEVAQALLPVYAVLLWPLFATAAGANTFAGELGDDSMRFLLSRPVSRARVWRIKLGVALAAFVGVIISTTLVSIAFLWITAANNGVFRSAVQLIYRSADPVVLVVFGVPYLFLFGCAVYCSMLSRRPLTATLGGFALAAVTGGTLLLIRSLLVPDSPDWEAGLLTAAGMLAWAVLATVSVYAISLRVFCRGDLASAALRRRAWRPLLIALGATALLGAVPTAYSGMRHMATAAMFHKGSLSIVDDAIVIPQRAPGGLTTSIVLRSLRDGSASVVVDERATNPSLSPDGEWIVYAGYGSYFAGPDADPHLRAVRIDGGDDHAISGALRGWDWSGGWWSILVAPDSDHVAFVGYGDPLFARISGRPEDAFRLRVADDAVVPARDAGAGTGEAASPPGTPPADRLPREASDAFVRGRFRRGGAVGWAAGEPLEFLYYRQLSRIGGPAPGGSSDEWGDQLFVTDLMALDPITGGRTRIRQFPGARRLSVSSDRRRPVSGRPWAWLPVWPDPHQDDVLRLVEIASGEMLAVTRQPCSTWGFDEAGSRFLYGRCTGALRNGTARAELRVLDLESGADELFAVLEGYAPGESSGRSMLLSPDGERLLVHARRGQVWGTYIVPRDGAPQVVHRFPPLAWRNATEAVVFRNSFTHLEIEVVNVDTGRTGTIF